MEFILIIGALFIFFKIISFLIGNGPECPICHSKRSWREYYWGSNSDTKTDYCSNCNRVQWHYDMDKFTIFDEPQHFL